MRTSGLSGIAVLAAVLLFSSSLPGDEQAANVPGKPARKPPVVEKESTPQPFEKTVRLEFKLQGFPNDPTFFVVCGESEYSLRYGITKPDTEFSVRIDGKLTPLNDQGKFLLTFKSELHIAKPNDGNEGQYAVSGSAIIQPDKGKRLATLGDGTLTVTATLDE